MKVTAEIAPPAAREVTLKLPEGHATILESLLGYNIVGPTSGPRGKLAEIWTALRDAGIKGERLGVSASPGGNSLSLS